MRVASTVLALSAPFPAFACGGACGTPFDIVIPAIAAAGFGLFLLVTSVVGRFS